MKKRGSSSCEKENEICAPDSRSIKAAGRARFEAAGDPSCRILDNVFMTINRAQREGWIMPSTLFMNLYNQRTNCDSLASERNFGICIADEEATYWAVLSLTCAIYRFLLKILWKCLVQGPGPLCVPPTNDKSKGINHGWLHPGALAIMPKDFCIIVCTDKQCPLPGENASSQPCEQGDDGRPALGANVAGPQRLANGIVPLETEF